MSISQNWPKCNSWYNTIFSWSLDWAMPVHGCNRGCLWDGSKSYRKTCCHVKANVWHFEMAQLKIARLTHFSALLFIMSNHSPRDPKSFLAPFLESVRIRPSVRARSDCVYHIQKLVWTCYKHRRFLKICTSGSYDMKGNIRTVLIQDRFDRKKLFQFSKRKWETKQNMKLSRKFHLKSQRVNFESKVSFVLI